MYQNSSGFDRGFCFVHSHFLPSIEIPEGKVSPSPWEPLTCPFTINLMLTFLMDIGDGGEETNLGSAISGKESVYEGNAADWFPERCFHT